MKLLWESLLYIDATENKFLPFCYSLNLAEISKPVLTHLKSITDPLLDPLQFAHRANRYVYDALKVPFISIHQHMDFQTDLLSDRNQHSKLGRSTHYEHWTFQSFVLTPPLFSLYAKTYTSGH